MNEHFLFLLANEYLNYRIFIDYYTHQLRKGITSSYPDDGEKQAPYLNELQSLAFQRELFESSLQTALKDFQDFVTTYPLHIGLVVYQERLLQFRDTIVKVVPYFYNLYEKLRNVQNAKN
ncbi:MAG: hypothetical protein LBP53_08410 [Candidatus Peribacteria bacterium]|nr:hypothetical protein [Candidatus Peribacteria bacterium]